jgi:BMFP domain-containing protein YqiC
MSYFAPYPNPNVSITPTFNNLNQTLPQQRLIPVNGIEGARAFQMGPNDRVPLFDSNEDICYIKSTDGAGFATIDIYDLLKRVDKTQLNTSEDYVTRDEFDALKEMIEDVKQYIWNQQATELSDKSDSSKSRSNQKTNERPRS